MTLVLIGFKIGRSPLQFVFVYVSMRLAYGTFLSEAEVMRKSVSTVVKKYISVLKDV